MMAASLPLAPATRGDCIGPWAGVRPTPSCSACRHWLSDSGVCVLDEVDRRGTLTLDEVGAHFHLTRERIRQIEKIALRKARRTARLWGLDFDALVPEERRGEGEE